MKKIIKILVKNPYFLLFESVGIFGILIGETIPGLIWAVAFPLVALLIIWSKKQFN